MTILAKDSLAAYLQHHVVFTPQIYRTSRSTKIFLQTFLVSEEFRLLESSCPSDVCQVQKSIKITLKVNLTSFFLVKQQRFRKPWSCFILFPDGDAVNHRAANTTVMVLSPWCLCLSHLLIYPLKMEWIHTSGELMNNLTLIKSRRFYMWKFPLCRNDVNSYQA